MDLGSGQIDFLESAALRFATSGCRAGQSAEAAAQGGLGALKRVGMSAPLLDTHVQVDTPNLAEWVDTPNAG